MEAGAVERERVLGALLLRLDRGVAVPFAFRACSSGFGEDVSCARGGGTMTSLRESAWEVEEEVVSLLLEPPVRKTCDVPLVEPGLRRLLLSEGLIAVPLVAGRRLWNALSLCVCFCSKSLAMPCYAAWNGILWRSGQAKGRGDGCRAQSWNRCMVQ